MKKVNYCNFNYYIWKWVKQLTIKNRETILIKAKFYYENNKKVLREKAKHKYRELSVKEKNIKREYEGNRCKNMTEEQKERLKECQNNYHEANKRNVLKYDAHVFLK